MLSILDMGYIARFRRGIRPSGHAMSVFEVKFEVDAGLRFFRGRRLDPLRTRFEGSVLPRGCVSFGVRILRSAAKIVAYAMMTVPVVIRGAVSRERGFASATGGVSMRSERDSRGGSRLAGSAPLGGWRERSRESRASLCLGGNVRLRSPKAERSRGGADPPIRGEDRGIRDDDRACGHSRSGFSQARLRFCHEHPLDTVRTRLARRIGGSAPPRRKRSFSQGGAFSFGGADPPICRDDRGIRDDDRACGHSRSGFSRGRLRFCHRAASRCASNRIRAADRGIRTPRREHERRERLEDPRPSAGDVRSPKGVRSPLGVRILRSAAKIVAYAMMTVPAVIRGAVSRGGGFASATGVVSIRFERDSRGGSEDPHPSAGDVRLRSPKGVRSLLGVQILRSAATIVASSMMTVPEVIRGAVSRECGFASAASVVSIRFEQDSRGGSEDPHPSAGTRAAREIAGSAPLGGRHVRREGSEDPPEGDDL